MKHRRRMIAADAVWLALVAATLLSAWLVEHQAGLAGWTIPVLMLVVAAKVYAVVMNFMEMHDAPAAWRWPFLIWIVLSTGMIALMHLISLQGATVH